MSELKRFTVITVLTLVLICVLVLIIDAQLEHGILNELEKEQTTDDKQVEKSIEKPDSIENNEKELIEIVTSPATEKETLQKESFIIVLDPGHQEKANNEHEPIGPGASETKPKVAAGTQGIVTKKPEYELTLEASLLLQEALEEKGFEVVLTRSSHQVDISNAERSQIANDIKADLFLRIHADGIDNAEVHGFSVLTPGKGNAYTDKIYDDSLLAAEQIVAHVDGEIPLLHNGIFFRDDLSGFNWSEVPVVLVELGFMTNPEEDKKLSEEAYLLKLTDLITEGVEAYIEVKK